MEYINTDEDYEERIKNQKSFYVDLNFPNFDSSQVMIPVSHYEEGLDIVNKSTDDEKARVYMSAMECVIKVLKRMGQHISVEEVGEFGQDILLLYLMKCPYIKKTKCCNVCEEIKNLKMCSKCKKVSYCSEECQRKDWKNHKLICK